MPSFSPRVGWVLIALLGLIFSGAAHANRLVVDPESNWIVHLGAAVLLYAHIGGGALGILSGIAASLSQKGGKLHRSAGKVFFWSMLVCYVIGAGVAPFLETQQSTNFVAAVLALYLLLSGISAAKRRRFVAGRYEKFGAIIAASITLMGALFMLLAAQSVSGSVDGSPPQAYVLFVFAGSIALFGELRVLKIQSLSQHARTVRHLWRMCMSFFIASGAAFFGQAQFFPQWFNASILPLLFGFFPLAVLLIYAGKYALMGIKKPARSTAEKTDT